MAVSQTDGSMALTGSFACSDCKYLVNRSIVRFNNRHCDEVNDLYKRSNYLSYRIWNFKLFKDIKLYDLGGLISALFMKEEDNKNKWRRRSLLF